MESVRADEWMERWSLEEWIRSVLVSTLSAFTAVYSGAPAEGTPGVLSPSEPHTHTNTQTCTHTQMRTANCLAQHTHKSACAFRKTRTHEQNNNMQSLTKPGVGHFSPIAFSLAGVKTEELSVVLKTFRNSTGKVQKEKSRAGR